MQKSRESLHKYHYRCLREATQELIGDIELCLNEQHRDHKNIELVGIIDDLFLEIEQT